MRRLIMCSDTYKFNKIKESLNFHYKYQYKRIKID